MLYHAAAVFISGAHFVSVCMLILLRSFNELTRDPGKLTLLSRHGYVNAIPANVTYNSNGLPQAKGSSEPNRAITTPIIRHCGQMLDQVDYFLVADHSEETAILSLAFEKLERTLQAAAAETTGGSVRHNFDDGISSGHGS